MSYASSFAGAETGETGTCTREIDPVESAMPDSDGDEEEDEDDRDGEEQSASGAGFAGVGKMSLGGFRPGRGLWLGSLVW